MFSKLFLFSLFSIPLFAADLANTDANLDRTYTESVVATVGNEVITSSDISKITYQSERELMNNRNVSLEEKQKLFTTWRISVLENLIEESLLFQEFKANEFQVPENLIIEEVNKFIDENCSGNREKYYQYLRSVRLTEKEFRDKIYRKIAVNMLKSENIYRAINVTDSEIVGYFQKNKDKFKKEDALNLGLIYVASEGKNSPKNASDVMKEIKIKLDKGENFGDLAKQYSDDGVSADNGGALGLMLNKDLEPTFLKQVEKLKIGQVTSPFFYENGCVILKVLERVEGNNELNQEVKDKISHILYQEKSGEKRFEYINRLTRRHFVQIFVNGTKINNSIITKEEAKKKEVEGK